MTVTHTKHIRIQGWLSEELMKKHGFEANAADCWEKNGGGKFSYKDPLGTGKKTASRSQRTSAKVRLTVHLLCGCVLVF